MRIGVTSGFGFAWQPDDPLAHIIGNHEGDPPPEYALCGVPRGVLSGDTPMADGQQVCAKCLALAPRARVEMQAYGHAQHEPRNG